MKESWPTVDIGDIATEVTVGHVGPMADEYLDSGVPFLRSLSVEPFRIRTDGLKYISSGFHKKLRKSALAPGDVVVVRTGKPGTCAVIPDWLEEANCSDLVIIRCGPKVRPHFLCYIVNSVAGHHIDSHTVGAVQQHFNVASARTLKFSLPPLNEQDHILALLRGLDDKIELNRQMNEALEATARAIFKDWFVDFGPTRTKMEGGAPYLAPNLWVLFPDRLDADGKPEGWKTFQLDEISCLNTKSLFPAAEPDTEFEHFSLPAFDSGQSPSVDRGETIKSNKTLVPSDAVLLSKLNPEIARIWLTESPETRQQVCSTEFLAFTGKNGARRGLLSCLFSDDHFRDLLLSMVTGTSKSHQRITPSLLMKRDVLIGTTETLESFDHAVSPFLAGVLANRAQSRTLGKTRDLLLPKLMSGEIRLRDAEKLVEAVA